MNMKHFISCKSISKGVLKLSFFVPARRNVIWLGLLHFMSYACKGFKPTSKIKTFDSNVKQKVHNDENC